MRAQGPEKDRECMYYVCVCDCERVRRSYSRTALPLLRYGRAQLLRLGNRRWPSSRSSISAYINKASSHAGRCMAIGFQLAVSILLASDTA